MNYLKKAKTAMKDVQDIQKGLKDMGFMGDKSQDKSKTASGSAAPSVAAHSTTADTVTASNTAAPSVAPSSTGAAFTPGTTPAASILVDDLKVPPSKAEGAPTKLSLAARKKIRDDYETPKKELEEELSEIMGTPWTIHTDTAGVYTYMKDTSLTNPGAYIFTYFKGAVEKVGAFKKEYGAAAIAQINSACPQHVLTLEPTSDRSVPYHTTDFHEGRWRILFRDTEFGSNNFYAGEKIAEAVNNYGKTAPSSSSGGPALSLHAKKSISDGYDNEVEDVLASARKILAAPTLTFNPNFEHNYATLLAWSSSHPGDVRDDWEKTMGPATLGYFSGFVSQLDWQKFNDDMMQEGFQDVINKLTVTVLVTESKTKSYCDCTIEDGVLFIRTMPKNWWTNVDRACEGLADLL